MKNRMRLLARPFVHLLLLIFTSISLFAPLTHASIISTEQALQQHSLYDNPRNMLKKMIDQVRVQQQFIALGVDPQKIQQRIDLMTNRELATLSAELEQLPAGQGVVSLLLTLFLVFLITDILGYTDIFPFVHHHHHNK